MCVKVYMSGEGVCVRVEVCVCEGKRCMCEGVCVRGEVCVCVRGKGLCVKVCV